MNATSQLTLKGHNNHKDVLIKRSVTIQRRWPANIAEVDKIDFEGELKYDTGDAWLKFFGKVSVSPDSVVYKNGELIEETLASDDHKAYYRFRHQVKKNLFSKKIRLNENRNYLLATDYWSAGHFHWFCDVLPKLIAIRDKAREFILLLPDTDYIRTIGTESLSMLGLDFAEMILMKSNCFYKVPQLYYASQIAKCGLLNDSLMSEMQEGFANKNADVSSKRYYVTREGADYRKVVNEAAFSDMLKGNGFEIIAAEDLSLTEQSNIFSSARTLLGIHGGGLVNLLFMKRGSKLIELRKKEGGTSNTGYWHLADSVGQSYYYYNGIPDSDKPLVGKGCNLEIPLKDFEEKILSSI